ncbi:MAG TPA: hypothetical protein ENN13_05270 [Candidatus Altiarchaeales archaeon]|nr:hypothetical protein [Candidatus Altiarchaeales archaeon]
MTVVSFDDFIRKLGKDVPRRVWDANRGVETAPEKIIVTEARLPEPKALMEFVREKPAITAPKLDSSKDLEVREEGVADLKNLVLAGHVGYMVSELRENEDAYVRKVETGFEGRENIARLEVWDRKKKTLEDDVLWKTEGESGRLGRFNDSNSASGLIAKAIRIPIYNERTWIPPESEKAA